MRAFWVLSLLLLSLVLPSSAHASLPSLICSVVSHAKELFCGPHSGQAPGECPDGFGCGYRRDVLADVKDPEARCRRKMLLMGVDPLFVMLSSLDMCSGGFESLFEAPFGGLDTLNCSNALCR